MSADAMKWLHCNVCTKQPHTGHDVTSAAALAADSVYMTNCGHVFCADCLPDTADAWDSNKLKAQLLLVYI